MIVERNFLFLIFRMITALIGLLLSIQDIAFFAICAILLNNNFKKKMQKLHELVDKEWQFYCEGYRVFGLPLPDLSIWSKKLLKESMIVDCSYYDRMRYLKQIEKTHQDRIKRYKAS
jgi:hypothetical protein